jgi:hypothetical protein
MKNTIDEVKAMVIDKAHCLFDDGTTALEHSDEYANKIKAGLCVIYTARPNQ